MNLRDELQRRIAGALTRAGAAQDAPALIKPSARPEFGDYQVNGCMAAAKEMKTNPRELASAVVEHADLDDIAETVEVAGPGFINITLKNDWLSRRLTAALADERLGVPVPQDPDTVVVDYSSPNLAKEMHVGHLRSTIIGDALARTLEFTGQVVIRQNHVGDWGTQFGMLIVHYREETLQQAEAVVQGQQDAIDLSISDMEEFYREAKKRFDEDEEFRKQARHVVVLLQQGGAKGQPTRDLWRQIVDESLEHAEAVYKKLGITLTRDDVRGESFYNAMLPVVLEDLDKQGLLSESEGARGVFLEEFKNRENESAFVIVQKSDGGYLYSTTDLAALRFRSGEGKRMGEVDWVADRILYVTDSRQHEHFQKVFCIAQDKAKWVPEGVSLEHVGFGMMLGDDGKPFKTRTGGTVKLMDLLTEAVTRARKLVDRKNPDLSEQEKARVAEVVGVGAVKYADLAQNRSSDYVFSWDKMLSLDGNTAPYMQYAYARVKSIFRRGEQDQGELVEAGIELDHPAERALAVKLAQLPETIDAVARECLPNLLCAYLFELAGAFMSFYESCPVLKADSEASRRSRLALCALTAKTIRQGLELLGIDVLEQM
ncbi:MAG: arginine--tRNA ligase [Planctomycetota bacterium]